MLLYIRNLKKEKTIFFLLPLIIFGFILRIYHLGIQSFWIDEAISANAAISMIEQHGVGVPFFPSGITYTRGILNTFLMASSFSIFGVSDFSARLPSAIFGTLSIIVVYVMGTKMGNRRIGLITAFFVTFSIWEIAWSRQARMYAQLQFFYLAALLFFYEFYNKKNAMYLSLTALFSVCAVLSHKFGYVLILVFISYFLLVSSSSKELKQVRNYFNAKCVILFILVIMSLSAGFIWLGSFDVISYVLSTKTNYLHVYLHFLRTELSSFFYLSIVGAVLSFKKNWKGGLLLSLSFIIPFYILSFHVLLLATRYLCFIFPILLIFSSYFFDYLIELSQGYVPGEKKKIKSIVAVLVIISMLTMVAFSPGFTATPKEEYRLGINAPQPNFKMAYGYIEENMQSGDVIIDGWPAVSLFYVGKSDYWLAFDVVGLGIDSYLINNGSNEIYANATVIRNVDMLKEVVEKHDRCWIVLDNIAWHRISLSIRDYISKEMQYHVAASDKTIKVYSRR